MFQHKSFRASLEVWEIFAVFSFAVENSRMPFTKILWGLVLQHLFICTLCRRKDRALA